MVKEIMKSEEEEESRNFPPSNKISVQTNHTRKESDRSSDPFGEEGMYPDLFLANNIQFLVREMNQVGNYNHESSG